MRALNKDSRDEKTWVVFELTRLGEKAAVAGDLEAFLKDLFRITSSQLFIPYKVCLCDHRKIILNVMEGYCFVQYTQESSVYLGATSDSLFLKSVMHTRAGYRLTLHTIPNSQIVDLKNKLDLMASSEVSLGDRVVITGGIFAGLEGDVIDVGEDSVCLFIRLRSLEAVRVVPKFAVTPLLGGLDG